MTTITEFIEYLKTLPPETEVSVVRGYDCGYSKCTEEVPLNIDPATGNVEYIDLTCNQFVKDDDMASKKCLILGET